MDAQWIHTGSHVPAVAYARLTAKRASSHVIPPSATGGDGAGEKFVIGHVADLVYTRRSGRTKDGSNYGANTNNE